MSTPGDKRDRWLRTAFVLLLLANAVLLIERASGPTPWIAAALAQVPDTGAQFQQQIDLLRRNNELLSRIAKQLETGPVPVRMVKKDAAASAKEGI